MLRRFYSESRSFLEVCDFLLCLVLKGNENPRPKNKNKNKNRLSLIDEIEVLSIVVKPHNMILPYRQIFSVKNKSSGIENPVFVGNDSEKNTTEGVTDSVHQNQKETGRKSISPSTEWINFY